MIHKLLGLALLLLVLNCKSTNNNTSKMVKENSILIAKGNLYGSGAEGIDKQHLVITDSGTWHDLLDKMNSVNNVSNHFSETEINFSKFTVIAVFDSVKTTGGHSIELDIQPNSENIEVSTIHTSPKGMASMVMTQPYYIVKVTKNNLPIVFKKAN